MLYYGWASKIIAGQRKSDAKRLFYMKYPEKTNL